MFIQNICVRTKKKSLGMALNDSIFTVIYYIFIQFNTLNFVII